ncbi:hypothetical protein ACRAWG_02825 [Methylobacterium sp. P31]
MIGDPKTELREDNRSKVSMKLDLLNGANIDSEMTAGQFRFFARVLQQLDLKTWVSTIGDERLCAELPDCRNRHTANAHRAAIRKLEWWDFEPGSGRHPTRYFLVTAIPERVRLQLEAKKLALQEQRLTTSQRKRDVVARPRNARARRGLQQPNTVVATPPVHIIDSHYQQAQRLQDETPGVHARERPPCACGSPIIREYRRKPTAQDPNGGNWIPICLECDYDWIPCGDEEFRQISISKPVTQQSAITPEAAYRRARDGL